MRLDGSHSRSGHCGIENISLPLPGIKPLPSSLQRVAIPSELFLLIAALTISKKIMGHPLRINEALKNKVQNLITFPMVFVFSNLTQHFFRRYVYYTPEATGDQRFGR
jgi:hypothetical protein